MVQQLKPANSTGLGKQVPPEYNHVLVFFDQAGFAETEAHRFLKHYEDNGWTGLKGNPIRNWKTKANEWIWELKRLNPHLRFK
jgi:hypothetical protein